MQKAADDLGRQVLPQLRIVVGWRSRVTSVVTDGCWQARQRLLGWVLLKGIPIELDEEMDEDD